MMWNESYKTVEEVMIKFVYFYINQNINI